MSRSVPALSNGERPCRATRQAVRAALAVLTPADAACLLLMVVQGFTAMETAQVIGATPQAVAKRFARAKQRLRAAYLAQNPTAYHSQLETESHA